MKIVFFIRSLDRGGAQRQLIELAKGLKIKGNQIIVLTFYSGGVFEEELGQYNIPVYNLGKKGRWDIFSFFIRLICAIRKEKPQILHAYLNTANVLSVLIKPFFPAMHIVWGVRASNMELKNYDWASMLSFKIECRLSRFADLIISNSYAGMDYVIKHGFPAHKMIVIHNGIDFNRFYPDPEEREHIRYNWGVMNESYVIGIVARFDPMKDHPVFFKAMKLLAERISNFHIFCVGDGAKEYRQKMKELCDGLELDKNISWIGDTKDLRPVYNALDILVSSSAYGEGFSNVVAEAMACGVPCIVTDVGDSALIVGDTGVVVSPGSPNKLAEATYRMLHNLELIDRDRIRNRIIDLFSNQRLIELTYNELLKLEDGNK